MFLSFWQSRLVFFLLFFFSHSPLPHSSQRISFETSMCRKSHYFQLNAGYIREFLSSWRCVCLVFGAVCALSKNHDLPSNWSCVCISHYHCRCCCCRCFSASRHEGEKLTGNGSEQRTKRFVFTYYNILHIHVFFETSCDNIIMFNDIEKRVSSITQKIRGAVVFCFFVCRAKRCIILLETEVLICQS